MDIVDSYLRDVSRTITGMSSASIVAVVEVLLAAWRRCGTTFIIGNGGSAATASHMMNDLTKLTRVDGQPPFRAMALTDNVPLMTAWANDADYSHVFLRPLQTFLDPSDVVLAISTSADSPNVVKAVEYARGRGAVTLAFTGRTGGRLKELVDVCVCVPSDDIGQEEDAHMVLGHATAYAIRACLATEVDVSAGVGSKSV